MEPTMSWMHSFGNDRLELTIFVTEKCNFRCVYCYEDFKLGKIAPPIVAGIKNLIRQRAGSIDVLQLSFFGGEPLLNAKATIELSSWAQELCMGMNIEYYGAITTNGFLLGKKKLEDLIGSGIRSFQITLDGDKQMHDQLRPTIKGQSTFDTIYSNLVMMADSGHDFECTIRFNIADPNFSSVGDFLRYRARPFSNDKRFTFHFHPIFGMTSLKLSIGNPVTELKELAELNGLRADDDPEEKLCYAARANNFVVRADGRVQKCTVALEDERNTLGRIHEDGTLEIDRIKFNKWVFAENKACPLNSIAVEKLVADQVGAMEEKAVY